VTEPADLAHDVLIRVAEFIRRLPADQLADLASGEAKLEVVPKGGRRTPAAKATRATGAALPRPASEIAATMTAIGDRAAVRQYLVDLKLVVAQFKQLASELGATVRTKKDDIIDDLVEWAVGRSGDADAISRVGGGR
jgi:hypothetical protein